MSGKFSHAARLLGTLTLLAMFPLTMFFLSIVLTGKAVGVELVDHVKAHESADAPLEKTE